MKTLVYIVLVLFLFCAYPVHAEKEPSKKMAYLTFDADMTSHMERLLRAGKVKQCYSPGLIAYLKNEHVPATFFVTGLFAKVYPDVVKELALQKEFSIQNHTYSHAAFEKRCFHLPVISTDQEKINEMQEAQKVLKKITGKNPTYMRHPGLCHSAHDDKLARDMGLTVSDDGIISGDAYSKNEYAIVNNVIKRLAGNDIIIMHTGGPHAPATEKAVKLLVPALKAKGYTFARME